MGDANLKAGQTIELNDGRIGIIRFIGETAFADGLWVGVEFDDPSGKNDGSVQGMRYFDSKPGHGMFLRPMGVARIVEEPKPKAPARPAAGRPAAPGAVARRATGSIDQGKSRPSSMTAESSTTRPRLGSRPSSIDTKSPAGGTRIGVRIHHNDFCVLTLILYFSLLRKGLQPARYLARVRALAAEPRLPGPRGVHQQPRLVQQRQQLHLLLQLRNIPLGHPSEVLAAESPSPEKAGQRRPQQPARGSMLRNNDQVLPFRPVELQARRLHQLLRGV